jgi:enterochelin esterase-like enzyme
MKNIILILSLICLGLTIISFKSKNQISHLESQFYTDSIYSNHLLEYRKHNIYLPKDFNKHKKYPILYATDGAEIKDTSFYKRLLDSLINNQIIQPILMVVSHSNNKIADSTSQTRGDGTKVYLQYRNFEYVDTQPIRVEDSLLVDRFENHLLYFKNELIPKVEHQFNQNLDKEDRYFYGVSNGAGFGLSLLHSYPDTIGTYLCFSIFGGAIQSKTWKDHIQYPRLYLEYGSQEPNFLKEDAEFLKSTYKNLNLFSEIHEFKGGHDYKKWNEKFTEIICKLFIVP